MLLKFARVSALVVLGALPIPAQVVMNEVLFMPDSTSANPLRTHQWVELYNAGPNAADLTNWVVSASDGSQGTSARTLPAVQLPPGAYLVVHYATGQNQLDFTNGNGDYYTGDTPFPTVWNPVSDELALYSPNGIVDFIAWATSAQAYHAGAAAADAIAASIWTAGDYVQASALVGRVGQPVKYIQAGYSIGRDGVSTDTNTSADFDVNGGRHALDMSPGRANADTPAFVDTDAGQQQPMDRRVKPRDIPPGDWTVMLYFAADSNITQPAYQSALAVAKALSSAYTPLSVHYLLFFKGQAPDGNGGVLHFGKEGEITGVDPTGNLALSGRQDLNNIDSADPQTLQNFITWGQTYYPAQKYALVILADGNGWKGLVTDEGSQGKHQYDRLYMGELKEALRGVHPFDLIAFDSPLMGGIEVAAQVSPYSRYMLSSEEIVMANTFPYGQMVQALTTDPSQSGGTLGSALADTWAANNQQLAPNLIDRSNNPLPMSPLLRWSVALTDLSRLDALVLQVKTWARELKTATGLLQTRDDPTDNVQLLLRDDALSATRFSDDNFMDLGDFATRVQKDARIPDCAKTETAAVLQDLHEAVIKSAHGDAFPNAQGLHIYFPQFRTLPGDGKLLSMTGTAAYTGTMDPYDRPDTRQTDGSSARAAYAPNTDKLPLAAQDEEDLSTALAAPVDWPRKATPGFRWIADYANEWQNFLTRYYRPVADNHIVSAKAPDGTVVQPKVAFGGACLNGVEYLNGPAGAVVQFSGKGSSDADMPFPLTTPRYYFWDLDSRKDCRDQKDARNCVAPTDVPDGADAAVVSTNNEDEDRDPNDTTFDDKDASGPTAQFTCPNGSTQITLMVWDDNHTFAQHNTLPHARYVHPQTDYQDAVVSCTSGPSFNITQPTRTYAGYTFPVNLQETNPDGSPAAGMPVTVMPSGSATVSGLGSGGSSTGHVKAAPQTASPLTVTTDSTGSATVLVSADAGGGSVTFSSGGKTQSAGFNAIQPNDPPPAGLQVNAPGSLTLNQPVRLPVTVLNQQGPVSEVTFFALTNNVTFTDNYVYGNGRGTQIDTDGSGSASVSITATAGGTGQILVVAGSTVKTIAIPITGGSPAPDTLTVTGTLPVLLPVGVQGSLTFTLQAGGQPAAGIKLSVQATPAVPGEGVLTLTPSPLSGGPSQLTTDAKGSATLQFTGTSIGISTLTVTVPGTTLQRTITVSVN